MSAEPDNIFERTFHNRLEDLDRVTKEALQFLEARHIAGQAMSLTNLAIEELGTNIIKYSYTDTALHEIRLGLELEPGRLLLVLEDDGREFNPLEAPEPEVGAPVEQRTPGGLGIHLIRKLTDQFGYQRCAGRNRLTVAIRL